MAWIEVHQELPTHRKTLKFKGKLKVKAPQAVGHLVMLWLWAIDNAPDGDVSDFAPDDLAEMAGYSGKSQLFIDALTESGFLDRDGDSLRLHDWNDYAGRLIDKRKTDAERKRQSRDAKREKDGQSAGCPTDGPRDGAGNRNLNRNQYSPPRRHNADARGDDPELSAVMNLYLDKVNASPSPACLDELKAFTAELGAEAVCHAINIAIDERSTAWSYIKGILRNYTSLGLRSLSEIQEHERKREQAKASRPAANAAGTSNSFLALLDEGVLDGE